MKDEMKILIHTLLLALIGLYFECRDIQTFKAHAEQLNSTPSSKSTP